MFSIKFHFGCSINGIKSNFNGITPYVILIYLALAKLYFQDLDKEKFVPKINATLNLTTICPKTDSVDETKSRQNLARAKLCCLLQVEISELIVFNPVHKYNFRFTHCMACGCLEFTSLSTSQSKCISSCRWAQGLERARNFHWAAKWQSGKSITNKKTLQKRPMVSNDL